MHLEHYVDLMGLQNVQIGIQGESDCFSAINHFLPPAGANISGFGAKVDIDIGAHFRFWCKLILVQRQGSLSIRSQPLAWRRCLSRFLSLVPIPTSKPQLLKHPKMIRQPKPWSQSLHSTDKDLHRRMQCKRSPLQRCHLCTL